MSGVIIKAGSIGRLTGGLSSLDLRDIASEADTILSAARQQAEQIVREVREKAEVESKEIRHAARREGYEEGHAEGKTSGETTALAEARERFLEDHSSLQTTLTQMIEAFGRQRDTFFASTRRDVVVLAIAIAARICRRFTEMAEVSEELTAEACQEVLDRLREADEVVIRAHPNDVAGIGHLAEPLSEALKSSSDIRIVEDSSVGRGGVIVETSESVIDAEVETRIERIADALVTDWRVRMQGLDLKR